MSIENQSQALSPRLRVWGLLVQVRKLIGKFSSGKFNVGFGSLCSDVKGYVTDDLCVDVCGYVHDVGRVVNGRKVMAAI